MWIEYLNNPFGLRVGDCVIRAISKALDMRWEDVYIELSVQGLTMGDLQSSNAVWSAYLKRKGFKRRDSMGRYSRDGGYSEDDYSERRGYSRDEAKDHIMNKLGEMMEDASPKERETIKKWMREMDRD